MKKLKLQFLFLAVIFTLLVAQSCDCDDTLEEIEYTCISSYVNVETNTLHELVSPPITKGQIDMWCDSTNTVMAMRFEVEDSSVIQCDCNE